MPLNLGGGGYVPTFRWASNQMSFIITLQQGDDIVTCPVAVQQVLVDLWNIRTGWRYVDKGQAPLWALDPNLVTRADNPDPSKDYKRAFLVNVYNSQLFQGDSVRQWQDSAIGAGIGIQQAFAEFEAQQAQHSRAEVPIIQMNGVTNHGQYNVPNLSVVGWTPRPAELIDKAPEPGAAVDSGPAQGMQQPQPAQAAPPPAPPQQPHATPPMQTAPGVQQPVQPGAANPPSGQMF